MTLCTSQRSVNFKEQKSHLKKIYWLTYREGWGISGVGSTAGSEGSEMSLGCFLLSISQPCLFLGFDLSHFLQMCFLFVVARMAGNSSHVLLYSLWIKRKETKSCSSSLCTKLALFGLCLFMGSHLARVMGNCDWLGQCHVSIPPTRVGVLCLAAHQDHLIRMGQHGSEKESRRGGHLRTKQSKTKTKPHRCWPTLTF